MAITDTLDGFIQAKIQVALAEREGDIGGGKSLDHDVSPHISDGTSTNQATCWLHGDVTVTQAAAITLSLADSADPFSTGGDSVPTADPEGLKIRAIMIENKDSTNFIYIKKGTAGVTSWFSGATDTLRIPAGGVLLATFPAGLDAINDTSDDEIDIQADTADVTARISVLYG